MIPIHVSIVAIPPSVWGALPKDRPLAELFKDASGAERRIRKGVDVRRDTTRYTQLTTHIEAVSLELTHRSRTAWGLFGRERASDVRSLEWSDRSTDHRASDYIRLLELLQVSSRDQELLGFEAPQPIKAVTWVAPGRIQALSHLFQTLKSDIHPAWLAFFPHEHAKEAWSRLLVAWREAANSFLGLASLSDDDEKDGLGAIGKSVLPPGKPVDGQRKILERVNTLMIERLMPTLEKSAQIALARTVQETIRFYRKAERSNSAVVVVVSQGIVPG